MYNRILVSTDGSETATVGLREAIRLAKKQGARLCIAHVMEPVLLIAPEMYGVAYEQMRNSSREAAAAILSRAQALASEAGVNAETRLVEAFDGPAGERIVVAAKEWQADLIVCGTHGRRGLRRIVLGSDAEFIVRHTPVPVLLIRHDSSGK